MATQCRDWRAWLNAMPPKPYVLHVIGDVLVSNPGVLPIITMREPQVNNPTVLMLDLHLVQQPGMWPQVMTCASARFDRVMPPESPNYQSIEIFCEGERIALIDNIPVIS